MQTTVSTTSRQRELHDRMETYIETRRRAFLPRVREIAASAGIPEATLLFLAHLRQVTTDDSVPVERLRRRAVYATREGWRARFDELVSAGLAEPAAPDWRITPHGQRLIGRVWEATREQQRSLPLPAEPLRRVVAAMEGCVRDLQPRDTDRLASIRRMAPRGGEDVGDAARAEQAMFELAVTHDDGHIAAWENAGYRGPLLNVLTQVWYGKTTRAELLEALPQDPADVDRHIDELIEHGDLERDGDDVRLMPQGKATRDRIEADTDRLGFAAWPQAEALERLLTDLDKLIAALPPEDQLPAGATH